jgi:DNA-binding CsgD family transcriptional regulator
VVIQGGFEDAVDAIYRATLDDSGWSAALRAVGTLGGGHGVTLEMHDRATRELLMFQQTGMPEDGVTRYAEHFHRVCPRLPWGRRDPVGTALFDYRFVDESQMRRLEFYEDFLIPGGFRYMVGGVVANHGNRFGIVAAHRAPTAGHADDATIAVVERLLPHLARALEIQRRLQVAEATAATLSEALDLVTVGVVALSQGGRPLFVNDEARRVCNGNSGLVLSPDAITARRPSDAKELGAIQQLGGGMCIDAFGARPLSLVAARLPQRPGPWSLEAPNRAASLLFIKDTTTSPLVLEEVLVSAYGLTPAEVHMAQAMAAGRSLADHAEQRGVSLNTVRTQLKRLRAKLGVRSQADLVRRLAQLAPVTRHPFG